MNHDFGWLMNSLPYYPETLLLQTHIHIRDIGLRPTIEILDECHPLAVHQHEGIAPSALHQIIHEWALVEPRRWL